MKLITLLCLASGVVFSAASAAFAYPTLAGYTGTGVLPDASVASVGQFQLAADFYNTDGDAALTADTLPGRVLYGFVDNWEIGGGYTIAEIGGASANTWNANLKYATPFSISGVDTAIGARYAQTKLDMVLVNQTIRTTNIYLAGSFEMLKHRKADTRLSGTVGVNWTNVDSDVGGKSNAFRVFGGLSASYLKNLTLAADIQSESEELGDTNPLYSVALRYAFTKDILGQVGVTNADITGVNSIDATNIIAGLDFIVWEEREEEGVY